MTNGAGALVALIHLEFHFPDAQSLKDKRMHVRRIRDRLRNRFNASVAEVGFQDLWQRCLVGVALVSSDRKYLEQEAHRVLEEVAEIAPSELVHGEVEYL